MEGFDIYAVRFIFLIGLSVVLKLASYLIMLMTSGAKNIRLVSDNNITAVINHVHMIRGHLFAFN